MDSLNLVMPIAAKTETINAVHIGYTFVNNPIAIPPKATCDMASPNSECLLNTKNSPTMEHITEMAAPVIKACCINPNCKISNTKTKSYSLSLIICGLVSSLLLLAGLFKCNCICACIADSEYAFNSFSFSKNSYALP